MKDLDLIKSLLENQVENFENQSGNLVDFFEKHLQADLHTMNLEDIFLEPDLSCLKNYENWLNGN